MKAAYRRPDGAPPTPDDNAAAPSRISLGRQLFFDPRLSGSGAMACATCHNPSFSWTDALPTGAGNGGQSLPRATPTLLNMAWGGPYFWDGRADTLEQQALMPIQSQHEMNLPHDQLLARVRSIGDYRAEFAAAYRPDGVSLSNIGKAIAAYERTIVSSRAPFDRWIDGDENAISPEAQRGFVLFNTKAHCAVCHSGWRFTDDGFHDIGVGRADEGRAAVAPGIEQLRFAFKTPTLRNIDRTAPYMHDGSLTTLEEVVAFYNTRPTHRPSLSPDLAPISLSAREQHDLVAFLRTLTSDDPPPAAPVLPR